ncbi:MAG: response regulator transcription factor [Roseiflexaceae bacterium]
MRDTADSLSAPIRALLVDDHILSLRGLGRLLSDEPSLRVVGQAQSGEAAIELLEQLNGAVDVLLMDVDMPGMGGISATQAIRKRWPHCRVLLLTGYTRYAEAGIRRGALGYITKNATTEELVAAIRLVHQGRTFLPTNALQHAAGSLCNGEIRLSERETTVVKGMADGLSDAEIANQLKISPETVRQKIAQLRHKVEARDRAHLISILLRDGLIR